jgi:hypothetical protein
MKIRQGFVSNSSSSSFVIAVPKGTPVTKEAFHQALFGVDREITFGAEYHHHNYTMSYRVVEQIIDQIKEGSDDYGAFKGKVTDLTKVVSAPYNEHPEIDEFKREETPEDRKKGRNPIDWEAYEAACDVADAKEAARVQAQFPDCDFYAVEFGDDTQEGCEIEHGPALRQPNVIRYSRH